LRRLRIVARLGSHHDFAALADRRIVEIDQTAQHPQQDRLAGTARPDQHRDLAGRNFQCHVAEQFAPGDANSKGS